ncbi:MAG: hypothetical protein AAGJ40_19345 [Planctomycetota bacterium]
MRLDPRTLAIIVSSLASSGWAQLVSNQEAYSLQLIASDLDDANQLISKYDINDDGAIDSDERQRLDPTMITARHDLNRDGRLTQVELALFAAGQRNEKGIEAIDRTVAERSMRKHDTNRNGQIDPSEISPAWPEQPDEIDVNRDGILTLSELTEAFAIRRFVRQEVGIIGVDQGWAIKIRNRHDNDRDGHLGDQEWSNTPLPGMPTAFDHDNDGRLSLMEIATMLAKHRQKLGLTAQDQLGLRAAIQPLDQDFNGILDPDEYNAVMANQPESLERLLQWDTDGNGSVTLAEMETKVSQIRAAKGYTDAHAAEARRIVQRQDGNRNQRIDMSELVSESTTGFMSQADLPNVDQDGDMAINTDELAKHIARQSPVAIP